MTPRRFARLRQVLEHRQPDLTVLMDNVQNAHNVSAVVRTCDAVGVFDLHAVARKADFRGKHQAAGGVSRWVRLHTYPCVEDALVPLKAKGCQILAAHAAPGALDFRSIDYSRPTAIVLGAERDGVSSAAAAAADHSIAIPMLGAGQSLNVSVAAAVVLFEAQRQRLEAGLYGQPRIAEDERARLLFEWGYPRLAERCRRDGTPYPRLGPQGELLDPLPR